MSKVRSSAKKSRTTAKSQTSMEDDDLAQVMDMMMDKPLKQYVESVSSMNDQSIAEEKAKNNKKSQQTDDNGMEKTDTTTKPAKVKKAPKDSLLSAAPVISAPAVKPSKVDRRVVGTNKIGEEMVKVRSKKERLKLKKQSLLEHLDVTITAPQLAKDEQRKAIELAKSFSFGSLVQSLNAIEDSAAPASTTTNTTAILNGAGQWKPTKKALKGLDKEKQKFEEVVHHPAFQQNSISAIQQHLTNQMALMKHIHHQNEPTETVEKETAKVEKNKKSQGKHYTNLINKKESLASSMKRK